MCKHLFYVLKFPYQFKSPGSIFGQSVYSILKTRSSGKNYFAYFPCVSFIWSTWINLTEINLNELTLTSFNPI
jgi:hypothetical protein